MLSLSVLQTAKAIRLYIVQDPEGENGHHVWVGAQPNNSALVHEFACITRDADVLEFIADGPMDNIRYIKIVTTQSPSRVAWREIRVIGK